MAQGSEERLLTLYADVHYFFSPPGPRPTYHRFDRGSYVYLYRDKDSHHGRLEIANHAGTDFQDAVDGYLQSSILEQSSKQPNLLTITVDALDDESKDDDASPLNEDEWRLPSTDPRDPGHHSFRLHTLDVYFWTADDAKRFIEAAHTVVPEAQMKTDVLDPRKAKLWSQQSDEKPHVSQSEVVQRLERMAVSSPAQSQQQRTPEPTQGQAQTQTFTPMAYNPGAPAAPEPIRHREKTPPPPDDGVQGTGLMAAAKGQPLHTFSPPPTSVTGFTSPFSSSGYISSPPPYPPSSTTSYTPDHRSALTQLRHSQEAMPSPASQILGQNYIDARVPVQHLQPQYPDYLSTQQSARQAASHVPNNATPLPLGGYSTYAYSESTADAGGVGRHGQGRLEDPDSIHQTLYRPTEDEHKHHGHKHKKEKKEKEKPAPAPPPQPPSEKVKIEQKMLSGAMSAEKKVNRFLQKLESKIG